MVCVNIFTALKKYINFVCQNAGSQQEVIILKKIRKDTAGIKKTQVNRKLHYKKMAALAVAGVLVAGSTLTGCGKKNIDYSVDGGSVNGGSADSGSLQDKYGIPESCDMTLETGDSGLSKLAIEADEVSVPSTMDLPIVYAKKKEISNDAKKATCRIAS